MRKEQEQEQAENKDKGKSFCLHAIKLEGQLDEEEERTKRRRRNERNTDPKLHVKCPR